MRIGVTLPSFRDDASAVDAARQAERLGLDGVFVFDHLWPIGQPRPARAQRDATFGCGLLPSPNGSRSALSSRAIGLLARRCSRRVARVPRPDSEPGGSSRVSVSETT